MPKNPGLSINSSPKLAPTNRDGKVRRTVIRILVADDFKDWLHQVRLLLQSRPEYQVIAVASDGLEAVQKAEELKPDLILLDIGLPKLNGIEAARRIRQLSPSSKIVFLRELNRRLFRLREMSLHSPF